MKDYYKVLGISKSASTRQIHETFKDLIKNLDKQTDNDLYRSYKEAYNVLIDYHQRRAYDEQLERGSSSLNPRDDFGFTSFDYMNNHFNLMRHGIINHMRQFDKMFNGSTTDNSNEYRQTYESKTIQKDGEMVKAEKYESNKDGNKKRKYRVIKKDKDGNITTRDIDPKTLKDKKDLPSLEYFGKVGNC